jgi:hypothetical protein
MIDCKPGMSRAIKIIVEKHSDGYVAYPLGLKGTVVGEGETYEAALRRCEISDPVSHRDIRTGGTSRVTPQFLCCLLLSRDREGAVHFRFPRQPLPCGRGSSEVIAILHGFRGSFFVPNRRSEVRPTYLQPPLKPTLTP